MATTRSAEIPINQAPAIKDAAARAMVQANMPHRKVEGNEFSRINGHYTLTILVPSRIGLPSGAILRLLFASLTTDTIETQHQQLQVGEFLSSVMRELGMSLTDGWWGSVKRLKEQTKRLFGSTINAMNEKGNGIALVNHPLEGLGYAIWQRLCKNQVVQAGIS
jgi:hypothetical protein